MTLVGSPNQIPEPKCKTVDLDHPSEVDFAAKSTFIANAAEQNLGWENCWQVNGQTVYQKVVYIHIYTPKGALDGYVQQSTIVWTGEGTWMPESICYDWDKENNRVFVCTFAAGTSLTFGKSAMGTCGVADGLECP